MLSVKMNKRQIESMASAYLAIRPENIRIAREKGDFENVLKAVPLEIIYLGEGVKVRMETEIGTELNVKIPSVQSGTISVGKELYVGWNANEATLIEENSSVDRRLQMSS